MPKDFSRPETLTKDILKNELKKHGVLLPDPRSLKQEYIDLYNREILRNNTSQFSSDDDEIQASVTIRTRTDTKNLSPKVHLEKLENMTVDGIQVSTLSDEELGYELRKLGMNIGPVGPTTRRLYERKLTNALAEDLIYGEPPASNDGNSGYSDHDSDENEDVEVTESSVIPGVETRNKRRSLLDSAGSKDGSATRRRAMRQSVELKQEESEEEDMTGDAPVPSSGGQKQTLKPDRKWVPVWVQFLIVMAVVVFFYFVSQSMESNPAKRIPGV